mgnify:FL=1
MKLFTLGFLGLFALVSGRESPAEPEPSCRGRLDNVLLTTTLQFPDGYAVEGPWRVISNREQPLEDGTMGRAVAASLDRVIEVDEAGNRSETPFPEPIETVFEGRTETELVYNAAQTWCRTVLQAHGARTNPAPGAEPQRLARVARAR